MKDLFLIPIMLMVFVFGYYIMTRVDRFIETNQRLIAAEKRGGQSCVRIAAESPMLLNSVASALESCSEAAPHISFFLSSGRADRILEKLLEEQVDIVLLNGKEAKQPVGQLSALLVPRENAESSVRALGLPVEDRDEEKWVRVVWKNSLKSKDRDRVIFALENEHCRLKCGYADYMS